MCSRVHVNPVLLGVTYSMAATGTTCGSTLAGGHACTFMVVFKPQSTGTKNELFRVFEPHSVKLHGVGTAH